MKDSKGESDWNFIWQNLSEGMSKNPGREYRFTRILSQFPAEQNLKVLDFGCGTGNLLQKLVSEFPGNNYYGADTSDAAIIASRSLVPSAQILKISLEGDAPLIVGLKETFDVVVCSEVIEHIENDFQTIEYLFALLKVGGLLILTVPSGPISKFDRFIGHVRHYTKVKLEFLLKEAGFVRVEVKQSGFPAINFLRIGSILMGDVLISELKKDNFAKKGLSKYVTLALHKMFTYSLEDSYFGWQLVSTSKKVLKLDESNLKKPR